MGAVICIWKGVLSMNAPPPRQRSVEEVERIIAAHVESRYRPTGVDGKFVCSTCGAEIAFDSCAISLHDRSSDECKGPGNVYSVALPYCPRCEGKPTVTGTCAHIPRQKMYVYE